MKANKIYLEQIRKNFNCKCEYYDFYDFNGDLVKIKTKECLMHRKERWHRTTEAVTKKPTGKPYNF